MSAPDITTAAPAEIILGRLGLWDKTLRITYAPDGGALSVFDRKESLQAFTDIGYASTENGIYHFLAMSRADVHHHLEDILEPGVSARRKGTEEVAQAHAKQCRWDVWRSNDAEDVRECRL